MAPSTAGGRWMVPGGMAVLYTSATREGALAEICFHLAAFTPLPSKPVVLHQLSIETKQTIRVTRQDFPALAIDERRFGDTDYTNTQLVGDSTGFLQRDALFVPSARWNCENLVIFFDNHTMNLSLQLISSESVEWQPWAKGNGFL
ncbi:MAG: RES family NAD+ phosphorylase [Betaproteobacteria bacterium]|nr:RES family NAD+ phosphorylase [Betaproteobacteria bacterium]